MNLEKTDPEIYSLIEKENIRQQETINLIASKNYVCRSVLEATASALTNKYSEGYPLNFSARVRLKNQDGHLECTLLSLPLYLVGQTHWS